MGYINEMYGERSSDFITGFLAAIDTYAVYKDGKKYIGCMGTESKKAMRGAVKELGGVEEHYPDLFEEGN